METGRRFTASPAHNRRMERVRTIVRRRGTGLEANRRIRRRRGRSFPRPPPPPPPPLTNMRNRHSVPDIIPNGPSEVPTPDQHQPVRTTSSGCGRFFSRILHRSRKTRVAPERSSLPRECEEEWRGICVICWDPYDKGMRRYQCQHKDFCRDCITQWKKKGDTCPLCRACPRGVRLFKR